MITLTGAIAWLYVLATSIAISTLMRSRDRYRAAWRRDKLATIQAKEERSRIGIENVDLRAEVARLRSLIAAEGRLVKVRKGDE